MCVVSNTHTHHNFSFYSQLRTKSRVSNVAKVRKRSKEVEKKKLFHLETSTHAILHSHSTFTDTLKYRLILSAGFLFLLTLQSSWHTIWRNENEKKKKNPNEWEQCEIGNVTNAPWPGAKQFKEWNQEIRNESDEKQKLSKKRKKKSQQIRKMNSFTSELRRVLGKHAKITHMCFGLCPPKIGIYLQIMILCMRKTWY